MYDCYDRFIKAKTIRDKINASAIEAVLSELDAIFSLKEEKIKTTPRAFLDGQHCFLFTAGWLWKEFS